MTTTVPRLLAVVLTLLTVACASRAVPPAPGAPAFPDFQFPVVPVSLGSSFEDVDRGWRYLQASDLTRADREFEAALRRSPGLYPAQTGRAYVALARRQFTNAVTAFDAALRLSPAYVPALVGRGQALLALDRPADALTTFEAALAADASLTDLRRRIEVLRFRMLEDLIGQARQAAASGRLDEAQAAFARAIVASPGSAFLHRELGLVERRRGQGDAALAQLRRAGELDAADAAAFVAIGEILEERQDFAGAESAYRSASAIEPDPALTARAERVAERARELRLPAEIRAIPTTARLTRGDLAALIAERLDDLLRSAPAREVVVTDIGGYWAATSITAVARAGVMDAFENHTFQPRQALRRADLASAMSRVITMLAASRPALRARIAGRPAIADMPSGHLDYPAVSIAVSAGIMPLLDGGRFEVARPVSGAEAVDAINRLQMLAAVR